jgi:hypothetical protein
MVSTLIEKEQGPLSCRLLLDLDADAAGVGSGVGVVVSGFTASAFDSVLALPSLDSVAEFFSAVDD